MSPNLATFVLQKYTTLYVFSGINFIHVVKICLGLHVIDLHETKICRIKIFAHDESRGRNKKAENFL